MVEVAKTIKSGEERGVTQAARGQRTKALWIKELPTQNGGSELSSLGRVFEELELIRIELELGVFPW